jgi:hypothetical protein
MEPAQRPEPDPDIRLVTVFATADPGVFALVTSLLDNEGIDYAVRGDTLRNVVGWGGPGIFNSAVGPAEFQVREEDATRAAALLARLERPDEP